jgi:predicted DCC family thiol-disulfide oxidoreductase YuxK
MRVTGRHGRLEWEHRSKLALLAAALAAVSLLWVGFTTLVVPALINSAYRGEGPPALNAIIEGRQAFPVEHYLQMWNALALQLTLHALLYGLLGVLIVIIARSSWFVRRYVADTTPGTLGVIRMLTCAALLVTTSWEDLSSVALLPAEMRHGTGAMGVVSALPGFERLVASATALGTLQWVTVLLLFLGAIGFLTRLVIPLSALAHFVVLGILIDYSFFWHQNLIPLYLLIVLSFTPCGDGCSVDRLWKLSRGRTVPERAAAVYGWSRYLCWLVIVVPYVQSGLSKLRVGGLSWWSPTNMRAMLYVDNLSPREYDWNLTRYLVLVPDQVFTCLGVTTIVLEVVYVLVLFSRKARWVLPTMMITVHLGIFVLQRILFFDLILLQLAFFDFVAIRRALGEWIAARRGRIDMLYDGTCPLCCRTVRLLRAVDLFTALQFLDFTRLDLAVYTERCRVNLELPQLETSMHVVSRGRALTGFAAWRALAVALPVFWPLAPWLVIPGIARLGDAFYAHIARNRLRLGTCPVTCQTDRPREHARLAAPIATPAVGNRVWYPLFASVLIVTSIACWIHRVEFYPLTAWHLYAMLETSGTVSYRKVLARYESGMMSPVRLEDGIGAVALDGRYTPMLDKCFGEPTDVALCQKFLVATASAYNAQRPPGSRVTHFEVQTWRWDFLSSPLHPEQGDLLDRVIIDISNGDETRERRMVGRSIRLW